MSTSLYLSDSTIHAMCPKLQLISLAFTVVSQLGSCVRAQTVGWNAVHANCTMTYQFSEPLPGSPSTCVTQWLDANVSDHMIAYLEATSV